MGRWRLVFFARGSSDSVATYGRYLTETPRRVGRCSARSTSYPTRSRPGYWPTSTRVVGSRGLCLATGTELALKVTETCRLPGLGLSSADLQHGPLAALGPAVPLLVAAAATGPTLPGLLATLRAARLAAPPVVVSGEPQVLRQAADVALPGTALPESLAPLAAVVPGQLLAEAAARRRGLDPDAPFGLAKVIQTA